MLRFSFASKARLWPVRSHVFVFAWHIRWHSFGRPSPTTIVPSSVEYSLANVWRSASQRPIYPCCICCAPTIAVAWQYFEKIFKKLENFSQKNLQVLVTLLEYVVDSVWMRWLTSTDSMLNFPNRSHDCCFCRSNRSATVGGLLEDDLFARMKADTSHAVDVWLHRSHLFPCWEIYQVIVNNNAIKIKSYFG